MNEQKQKADRFRSLHVPGRPLILCNVWNAGSAKTVAAAGAKALATSSWSVAVANGYEDGEHVPREFVMTNLRHITRSTSLPVSVDIESGYGKTPEDVRSTVALTIEAGAIGCNLEDSHPADGKLRDITDQVARIRQARKAAEQSGIDYFINARCDVFMAIAADRHDSSMIQAARERAIAYADAGASGFFVPGLVRLDLISELTDLKTLPVNVMLNDMATPIDALAKAGVARISCGPAPYLALMNALSDMTRAALGSDLGEG